MSKQRLESFVKRIMEGRGDVFAKEMFKEHRGQFISMAKTMEVNERTIAANLKKLTEKLFENQGVNYGYVLSLLMFCVELDKQCKIIHTKWYTTEKMIDILVDILLGYNFSPPIYSYNRCNIIYFACFYFVCYLGMGR